MIFKEFKIADENLGPKIKALLEAVLRAHAGAENVGREIFLEANTIIIKDTKDNIQRAEKLMRDRSFIHDVEAGRLDVAVFDLTPREVLRLDQSAREKFAAKVEEVVKTILYSNTGMREAREKGRKMWFDKQTLQMTITDYNTNIRKVADYISSLPELVAKRRSKIIFLKYANAGNLSSRLEQVLGISGGNGDNGTSSGESVVKTLRVEDELIFRDLRLRVVRVEENDVNDDNDDAVELVIRTPTDSRDLTIEEFRSEFVDDYEINVLDVEPSSSKTR